MADGNGMRAPSPTERLLAMFNGHRLSPIQRRIAQYLLDHMPEAAFLSSVEVAERVEVSQPSVTRFAVTLGFSGYPALREALRPIALSAPDSPEDIRRNGLQAAVDGEIRHLTALRDMLADPGPVLKLGRELSASTPLTVLGTRISGPLAAYFAYGAKRIHPDIRLAGSGSAVNDDLLQSREAGGTWVLAFAMPRYAAELRAALKCARELGLRTAVITDVLMPFASDVDVLLSAGVGSRLVFDSYAAPMVLATVLLQAMADADPDRTQRRLDAYEQLAERHGFFAPG
ncbi:transcriptional regulator [Dactylosporangium sucinum]|uniref:Transcriptional regulator n=2 Tax=Dactylosporangium sucinum TaxID=1424081 RepID=A0A917UBW4_9ACTN|nr:transcriptional regulator [Dactylosporangium sucinum]